MNANDVESLKRGGEGEGWSSKTMKVHFLIEKKNEMRKKYIHQYSSNVSEVINMLHVQCWQKHTPRANFSVQKQTLIKVLRSFWAYKKNGKSGGRRRIQWSRAWTNTHFPSSISSQFLCCYRFKIVFKWTMSLLPSTWFFLLYPYLLKTHQLASSLIVVFYVPKIILDFDLKFFSFESFLFLSLENFFSSLLWKVVNSIQFFKSPSSLLDPFFLIQPSLNNRNFRIIPLLSSPIVVVCSSHALKMIWAEFWIYTTYWRVWVCRGGLVSPLCSSLSPLASLAWFGRYFMFIMCVQTPRTTHTI